MKDTVAILDFGGQFTKVIDRRVRELGVNTCVLPRNSPAKDLMPYGALILSGSPDSVSENLVSTNDREIFQLGIPILGICYGMQLMNFVFGGQVGKKEIREDGQDNITVQLKLSQLFFQMQEKETVLLTHGDSIAQVATGFQITATSSHGIVVAIEDKERKCYGVQFHPEVDLTIHGQSIFSNFLFHISSLEKNFTVEDREGMAISQIKEKVGENHVLVLVSGGVDSSVCAALVAKAIPHDRVHCLHIDNGFMRKDESKLVIQALKDLGVDILFEDASELFYSSTLSHLSPLSLDETISPENKRKIIGDTFMKVAEKAIQKLQLDPNRTFLAQGTLRPDLIESAGFVSSSAQVIKTHHNDTHMVRVLRERGRVLEPLRDYHKDEVRILGEMLGLPKALVWRQPFPGPGLSVRCICTDGNLEIDDIQQIEEKLHRISDLDFEGIHTTILPVRSVGVQGDGRSYGLVAALSCSYLTIQELDWERLFFLAKEIPKRIHLINRVAFVFGEENIEQVHIVPTLMKPDILHSLQECDSIASSALDRYNLTKVISQMPVILIPISFGNDTNKRSIVLRPFKTNDFMTGVPALPPNLFPVEALQEILTNISRHRPEISRVLIDLTCKPPGTTEWE